jgi:hypothetical protein
MKCPDKDGYVLENRKIGCTQRGCGVRERSVIYTSKMCVTVDARTCSGLSFATACQKGLRTHDEPQLVNSIATVVFMYMNGDDLMQPMVALGDLAYKERNLGAV